MTAATNQTETLNPFDPARLRLSPDLVASAGVKKLLTHVPVGKPNRQDFVRTHPSEDYRLDPAALIEIKEDREVYLVVPELVPSIPGEYRAARLVLCVNRQGVARLWPIWLPSEDGKTNPWHESAAEAAELAMDRWVRIVPNMGLGANEIHEATGNLPDPKWPTEPFHELLKVGFKGRVVDNEDHPLLQRLRGEA